MSQINVGVDISKADALIKQLNDALIKSGQVAGDFTVKMAQLDDQGKATRGSLEQLNSTGQKLTATFDVTGNTVSNFSSKITAAGTSGASAGQQILVSWQQLVRVLEVQVFRRAVTSVINATRDGTIAAQEFQIQLQQIGNVSQQGSNLTAFSEQIRSLSDRFGVSLIDTLKAAQPAITSQLGNTTAGIEVLTAAMQLNRATGVALADTNKLVTTTVQAFGLSNTEAAAAANTLFATSQNVRVPMTDIEQAFQKIGPSARSVGLDLTNISALFQTISQQGGRPSEAFGQLDQIISRLRQPTEALKSVFASLGVTSARAGIQTFGLVDFLRQLAQIAERTPAALGDLAAPLRTFGIELALNSDNIRRFQENINNLRNSPQALSIADSAQARNPAQQLRDELNKFRNVFEEDIGAKFIAAFGKVNTALGGSINSAKTLLDIVISVGAGMGLFKLATEASNLAVANLGAGMGRVGDKLKLNVADAAVFTNTLMASYAAGTLILNTIEQINRQREQARAAAVQATVTGGASSIERIRTNTTVETERTNEIINRSFQGRVSQLARERQLYDAQRQVAIDNQRQIQDAYKETAQRYIETLRSNIAKGQQEIAKARSEIESSQRSQAAFAQNIQAQQFQRSVGIETDPNIAISLLQRRAAQLRSEREATFANRRSTPEQIAQARNQGSELQRIYGEIQQRADQIRIAEATASGNYQRRVIFGREMNIVTLDHAETIRLENQLIADTNRLEEQRRIQLEKTAAKQAQDVAKQQSNLRVFESSLRRIEQFRLTNDQGELAARFQEAEFQQRGGGVRQAREQFNAVAAQIQASGLRAGMRQEDITALINQAREGLNGEIALLERRNQLNARGVGLAREQAQITAENTRLQNANRVASEKIVDIMTRMRGVTATLRLPTREQAIPAPTFISGRQANVDEQVGAAAVNRAIRAKAELESAQAELSTQGGQTTENLNRFRTALEAFQATLQGLTTLTPRAARNAGLEGFTGANFQDVLRTAIATFSTQLTPSADRPGALPGSIQEMINTITTNMATINAMQGDAQRIAAQQSAQTPMQQLAATTGTAAINMGNLDRAVVNLTTRLNTTVVAPRAAAPAGQSAIGGMVAGFPGAPRGTDVLPYWLSKGEYVMDAKNTSKWYTQLVSMSHGQTPQYAAKGGVVVGDIHVTANMSGVNDKSVRQLGRAISREIKRGTISFN